MDAVKIGRTRDDTSLYYRANGRFRKGASVLRLPVGGWNTEALLYAEHHLSETPCLTGQSFEKTIFPDRKATELLAAAWLISSTRH